MRILSQSELSHCTKGELSALLNSIAQELPRLPSNSADLRTAHANLQNIRRTMVVPKPQPARSAARSWIAEIKDSLD